MKILAVRFQNLNSLKGQHEIRFDQAPLAEAGLFAITGPTGAGKTTILDAITVGLYGLVHRHSNDKPLELMTRHTAESSAEVEFEANGRCYRSKWHIRRSRGKADGNMQAVHMELCDLADEKNFDLKPSQVPDKVAELCGLDYNQFLRSVMLSQGDFARFLKANPNERSSLLEKITETGIYSDISRFAFEKAKTERSLKEEMERRLQDTKLLPEEQLVALQTSIAELQEQEEQLRQEATMLQEQSQWLGQVQKLQAKEQQHKQALHTQEVKLAQLQPDFRRLEQHEHARQYEGQLTRIELANGQLVKEQTQLETLVKQLPVLETELELSGRVAEEAGKQQQQQETALQELEPLLQKVAQLDHQLQTIRDQFQENKKIYEQLDASLKQEQSLLQQKQSELQELTQKAISYKTWLQQNQRLQDLQQHLPEFRLMVKSLAEVSQSRKKLEQEQQALQQQLQQDTQQLEALSKKQEEQQAAYAQLTEEKQQVSVQLQEKLNGQKLEELEALPQAQQQLLNRYERLLELSRLHTAVQQKQEQLELQLEQQQKNSISQKTQLEVTRQKYADATERLQDLQQLVTQQQRIQELEQARHALQPNEPCPLCGSAHHPFVEGAYETTLTEEVQRRDKQQLLVKELEASLNNLQLQLHTLQHQQEAALQQKTETDTEIKRLQQAYQQQSEGLAIAITAPDLLANSLEQQRKDFEKLNHTLSMGRSLSRTAEQLNQRLQQIREEQLRTQGQQSRLEQSEKMHQAQLQKAQAQLQEQLEEQQDQLEMAASFAAAYGASSENNRLAEQLRTFEAQVVEYQQKHKAYEDLRDPFQQLQENVKNMKTRQEEKQQDLKERQEHLKQTHINLTKLKEERTQLFSEKDPQKERQKAQQQLIVSRNQAEKARTRHLQTKHELHENRQRQQEIQQSQQQSKSALDNLRDGLLRVLQQQGIETIEALSQMLLDKDEALRLANLKAQTEKHLTELRKSLTDVQHELAATRQQNLTDKTAEELQELHLQKTTAQRNLIEQRARHQQLLEQDAQQREKNRDLAEQLQTQQQVCNRWEQLSQLIGSADGNKFSRFAQGLTLARLVELANRHLQKLNDRYRIQKSTAEDLELLIVDTYQAEAVRPMNTLSGGESFLVSLALALGLSDLAGRRTQINSLFIDEGFGTLDAETLDAAISTLENLQAGGKMIGIISHVEALKERISTQIRVKKLAGGVSKVEVV
ncbi:ATP-binding cassette family protein [Pontibacter qinzhouensis]|uniref:ATP-binding cassette family protein n=1 Tax=Pontibacter qinzhouensis TaxID=2603253 RepID=A0A5C8K8Y1_9BACT|nr:SbcC/MukB-like Walker B domain-containing protein [Pontibacter qinzhouensis]TXK50493.1 ATP-binding cassette family protein [Pontibacter qinzhouensis]